MRRSLLLTVLLTLLLTATAAAQTIRPRIVGGTQAPVGAYPWQVALLTSGGSLYCGGTLIGPRHVLTAEHCEPLPGDQVRVNSVDRQAGGQLIDIEQVHRHPNAFPGATVSGVYAPPRFDVNILVLADDVVDARPIAVATAAERALWNEGTLLTITGWGRLSSGGPSSQYLQEARLPAVADADCDATFVEFDVQDMVCAGYPEGGIDTCQGDSGGPLVAPAVASPSKTNPADWRLVGVTSWGAGCAEPGYPGVYARIGDAPVGNWIEDTLAILDPRSESPPPAIEAPAPDVLPAAGEDEAEPEPMVVPEEPAPEPVPVQPAATDPEPATAPGLVVSRRCTRARRCEFTIRPTADVAAVRASVQGKVRRACTRREMRRTRRTVCNTTVSKKLHPRRHAGRFIAGTPRLRRGRYTLVVTPVDRAGRKAAPARRVAFTVR